MSRRLSKSKPLAPKTSQWVITFQAVAREMLPFFFGLLFAIGALFVGYFLAALFGG